MLATAAVSNSKKFKIWTDNGLAHLGRLIRASRIKQGLSLDDFAKIVEQRTAIKLSKKTIGNVENATGTPQYNTLAAIAAASVITDDHGKHLSIDDFIKIASEVDLYKRYNKAGKMTLSEMIQESVAQNKLSQEDLEQALKMMLDRNLADLSIEKFRAIQVGAIINVTDDELRVIRNIVDPDEAVFSAETWEESANLQKESPTRWQGHANNTNLVH